VPTVARSTVAALRSVPTAAHSTVSTFLRSSFLGVSHFHTKLIQILLSCIEIGIEDYKGGTLRNTPIIYIYIYIYIYEKNVSVLFYTGTYLVYVNRTSAVRCCLLLPATVPRSVCSHSQTPNIWQHHISVLYAIKQ